MVKEDWDLKDSTIDRVIGLAIRGDPYGQFEGSLASPEAVKEQSDRDVAATNTIMADEAEVVDTGAPAAPVVSLRKLALKSDDESKQFVKAYHDLSIAATISRQPNRWDVNGSITLAAPGAVTPSGVQPIWQPRIGRAKVEVLNVGTNPIYIAPVQDKLMGGTNRGLEIAPGDSYSLETEAGGWAVSPLGSTITVIDFWYEDAESRPPDYKDESS